MNERMISYCWMGRQSLMPDEMFWDNGLFVLEQSRGEVTSCAWQQQHCQAQGWQFALWQRYMCYPTIKTTGQNMDGL